uniref:Histone deacetylase putative n=1 Tax=Albugo laibachii Nc14 TaxID=890382 RepID=F0WEW0_9STRA|nr:histone deacetylase putative [Albugo laibachii Nc14]|eukprot:CCA19742.1 histone deacetylase putative [Albugo laibachii Nc14]
MNEIVEKQSTAPDDVDDCTLAHIQQNQFYLHDLIEKGNENLLRRLLPPEKDEIEDASFQGIQVKMAAETYLLEKDEAGCLPIHIGILYQRVDCVEYLLQYSIPLTCSMMRQQCGDLETPFFHLLIRMGALHPEFVTRIFRYLTSASDSESGWIEKLTDDHKKDLESVLWETLNQKDDGGNTVFHLCARYDLVDCFKMCVSFYVGHSLSHQEDEHESMISAVLERHNRVGYRPLHVAMRYQSTLIAEVLVVDHHVCVSAATSNTKETPAHKAASVGFMRGLTLLQQMDHSIFSQKDYCGKTPLQVAEDSGYLNVSQVLANSQAQVKLNQHIDSDTSTVFLYHDDCLQHLPAAYYCRGEQEPPPECPERLETLLNPKFGILRSKEFVDSRVVHDTNVPHADIADILRVHDYHYVNKIQQCCERLKDDGTSTTSLDSDTTLSANSYNAATRAAGAVCRAVDLLMQSKHTNAFCLVRPPGHHAGPVGKVVSTNDPEGSNGFCLFNNVAIGAAYARSMYKHAGMENIAILDFDVHHGNGTEEIVRHLTPRKKSVPFETAYGEGVHFVHQYKPWRNTDDADHVFFCSVHGYGVKMEDREDTDDDEYVDDDDDDGKTKPRGWFYPASGATNETIPSSAPYIWNVGLDHPPCDYREKSSGLMKKYRASRNAISRLRWRQVFREEIFPALMQFKPDIIFLSSGFDAHTKEYVNWGYVSLLEQDYEWLTDQIKLVAETCCQGRIISVLEGGYNFHGRVISPFARSVAAHARSLIRPSRAVWSSSNALAEKQLEERLLRQHEEQLSITEQKMQSCTLMVGNPAQPIPLADRTIDEPLEGRGKRKRKAVDYVALAEQLAKEDGCG